MNEKLDHVLLRGMYLEDIQSLIALRKNPLLFLNDEINPTATITISNELQDKEFPVLDLVLHTTGGSIESAYKIVKLLRRHAKRVNIIVPAYAKSAGTLICLAAETLVLTTIAELGPLDVQIKESQEGDVATYKSALNRYKALEQIQAHALESVDNVVLLFLARTSESGMRLRDIVELGIKFAGSTSECLYNQIDPKTITEAARSLDVAKQYGMRILERYMGWEKTRADPVIHKLVYDYPSHEFIIDREEISQLGFSVEAPQGDLERVTERLGISLESQKIPVRIKLFEPSLISSNPIPIGAFPVRSIEQETVPFSTPMSADNRN